VDALLRRCQKPEPLPLGGCIVRNALTDSEQEWLYEALARAVDLESEEVYGLRMTSSAVTHKQHNPDNRPQPFVTWVHPYTRASNARQRPTRLLEWAEKLMHALAPASKGHVVDSMLAQLYAHGGSLLKHRDEDLSWGIGVSLGSTAAFDCLPEGGKAQRVMIGSGDILVGEFGLMPHAVMVPSQDNPPPPWWKKVDCFGTKRRCNVLFRQALSEKRQRKLADERARKVYGMSLAALREQTGKDDAFLSVHLRHAALE
jgi:alkylated DNA repair dioxygenase AlkB